MKSESQDQNIFWIYKITNIKNNLVYIGKGSGKDPYERWKKHIKNATIYFYNRNECPKLYNSIRKYTIESFTCEIINFFDDETIAYQAEDFYVNLFDSWKNGLNTTPGGIGNCSGKDHPFYGKGYLIAGKKNGMYGRTGDKNPFYGKKHTEQYIKDMQKMKRTLADVDIIAIKQMIEDKVNYKLISSKFNISFASISRIKTGKRYADVDPNHNFIKYNKCITDEDAEYILRLWKENPIMRGKAMYPKSFYDEKIVGKFNILYEPFKSLLRGERWKNVYDKVYGPTPSST